MPNRPQPKLNLRILILAFVLLAAMATLGNSFWVMFKIQKQELIDNALQANQAYAERIASGVQQVLSSDQTRLQYASLIIARAINDPQQLAGEAQRLLEQDNSFNSVLITDARGTIIASAPASLGLNGQPIRNQGPLKQQQPIISNAFKSLTGHLVVFVSQPVFDAQGQYLGLVGGSIRLEQKNALQDLMDRQVRQDGAHVYLVDSTRRVLYHPYAERIGSVVAADPIVDAALSQSSTALQAQDAHGEQMLAGVAYVPSSRWGVISQQPLANIYASLEETLSKIIRGMIPLALFGLLLMWWLGARISVPLSRLAESAKRLDSPESYQRISAIATHYVESWQIRRALLLGTSLLQEKIGRLNQQAQSDALTGLANRRAMQDTLTLWRDSDKAFAIVSMDIDHFKRVNDTYGHAAGDVTLQVIANLMRQNLRSDDLACRVGGEEFMLLLPNSSLRAAADVAERLRASIEAAQIETVGHITVSLGVTLWRPGGVSLADALEKADQLLYQAKQQGRNRVVAEELSQAPA
ncbi:diguanylate cyclase [Pseudomonas sp. NFXW11]|uniref:sensor domain-containing diguanylate cyclase n=1 Tax=Pseudomonas sp. NFXW11 TaxID=2819531 RepID=UPI003CF5CEFE